MVITKLALPRRTFLRGVGTTLALPLLDAMVPAFTARARTAAAPVTRLGFIYRPNGYIKSFWTPDNVGLNPTLKRTLEPFEPFRDRMTIVSGLANLEAETRAALLRARLELLRREAAKRELQRVLRALVHVRGTLQHRFCLR